LRRLRQRRRLILLRDDHIGDPLSAIFLDPSLDNEDVIIDRLRDYLGARVRVVKAEVSPDRVEVDVEVQALADEASRLAAAAMDLSRKGGYRNARALFQEALELDPLNRDACQGLGQLLAESNHNAEALGMLKLARECGPETVELLHALARVCLKSGRTASAIAYLERGFELDPAHFGVRRSLTELGRKPRNSQRIRNPGSPPVAAKPNAKQH
jgi:tetratricopeptide (TPR) repeat protein